MSPLGQSVEELWGGLVQGRSGVDYITLADASAYPSKIAGEVSRFDHGKHFDPKEGRRMARFSQLAVAAATQAISDAGLNLETENRETIGVVIGNGIGGFPTTEQNARVLMGKGGMRMSPFFIPMTLPNMAAANISRVLGLTGYTSTIITACAAGTQAVGEGAEVIIRGESEIVVAGGTEAGICELGLGGFNVIKALSRNNDPPQQASRPFDATRDGFVPAEGAGILVLESFEHAADRGAAILAEIIGRGVSSDAHHPVQPDEDGRGASRAMKWALSNAGIGPGDLDYINAHGTGTQLNDLSETLAIKLALGAHADKVPISSTKSMIGHALGAAGGLEAIVSVKTILENEIHPTINYRVKDPLCDLDYVPNHSRRKTVDTVMSNGFGFGGQNACLVLRRFVE